MIASMTAITKASFSYGKKKQKGLKGDFSQKQIKVDFDFPTQLIFI